MGVVFDSICHWRLLELERLVTHVALRLNDQKAPKTIAFQSFLWKGGGQGERDGGLQAFWAERFTEREHLKGRRQNIGGIMICKLDIMMSQRNND